MTLECMSVVFSNTQDKNAGDSVHSSVVFPEVYKIFYLNGEQINCLQSTWKPKRTWVKVSIVTTRTVGLQTCLIAYYGKKATDVTYLDLSFLVLSLVTSCKQDRGVWLDNNKVRWDQNLLGIEFQGTIISDLLSEWKGTLQHASSPVGCPGTARHSH